MIQIIIALLLALGIISSPSDFYDMTPQEQDNVTEIVIDDVTTILDNGE